MTDRYGAGLYEDTPADVEEGNDELWIDLRPRWPLTHRLAFHGPNSRSPRRKRLHTSLTKMTELRLPELTCLSRANGDKHNRVVM